MVNFDPTSQNRNSGIYTRPCSMLLLQAVMEREVRSMSVAFWIDAPEIYLPRFFIGQFWKLEIFALNTERITIWSFE